MKDNSKPIPLVIITMAAMVLLIAQFSFIANSEDLETISASPGEMVTYQGHGNPNSRVTIEVSASISVGVDGDHKYKSSMHGVNVPGGSHFSITARPVNTLTITGSMPGLPFAYSKQGNVSNGVGSVSMGNIPTGTYDIDISGTSNDSENVSLTVRASQPQGIRGDGTFTASISTAGLPAATYTVKQNGTEVAKVYLGADAPATPTPTSTTRPESPTATSGANPGSAGESWPITTIAIVLGGAIIALAAGCIVAFVIRKK